MDRDGIRRYTIETRLSEGRRYSQSDESTGQTVDSFTSFGGAFMAAEDSISGALQCVLPTHALDSRNLIKVILTNDDGGKMMVLFEGEKFGNRLIAAEER